MADNDIIQHYGAYNVTNDQYEIDKITERYPNVIPVSTHSGDWGLGASSVAFRVDDDPIYPGVLITNTFSPNRCFARPGDVFVESIHTTMNIGRLRKMRDELSAFIAKLESVNQSA